MMLAWLKKGKHWYGPESDEQEFSVEGWLSQLLTKVRDHAPKEQVVESLKAS